MVAGHVEPIDRLSAEDARILALEAGNVRGHTCKLLILGGASESPMPTADALRAHIDARLDAAPRLRRRLAPVPLRLGPPAWVDDPGFDIARHVRSVPAPDPVDMERLRAIVAELMAERLDRDHPLWRLDVVESMSDGSVALIWRIHHCLADGNTAMRLGRAVLGSDAPGEPAPPPSAWRPAAAPGALSLVARGAAGRLRATAARVPAVAVGVTTRLRRGGSTADGSRRAIERELARVALPTPLDRHAGHNRRVAVASAPLADCRRAGKAIDPGVTVNDVVLAVVAGGLRGWLEQRHRPEDGIRVKVPVCLHDPGAGEDTAANRDSYFFVDLPVGAAGVAERVLEIARQTAARKRGHDAEALYAVAARHSVARRAMSPRVFTLSVSNVPGPREDVYVMGAPVRELYSFAEIAEHHVLRISVISVAGTLFFGLCADRDAVEDVELIADGIRGAVRDLLNPARAG
jgi:diacylglycerol O-acyltransferase / wax synthase